MEAVEEWSKEEIKSTYELISTVPRYGHWGDLPPDFEGWRCHGGELGGDGEKAVEFTVMERSCQGGGDAGKDPAEYQSSFAES